MWVLGANVSGHSTSDTAVTANTSSRVESKTLVISQVRELLALSKSLGSNAMSYHYTLREGTLADQAPFFYFATGMALSRKKLSSRVLNGIARCHQYVLREGRAISLLRILPETRKIDPELTDVIMRGVNARGVADEYMIPAYGAFDTKAVISFGFPFPVADLSKADRLELVTASKIAHDRIVRSFGKRTPNVELSKRELAVLRWIARGKSNADIADILDISRNSVDTYTRRIFKKLEVHDRISAVMKALREGNIDAQDTPV